MTRDYQHRANPKKLKRETTGGIWKWVLFVVLTGSFVAFLVHLSSKDPASSTSLPPPSKKVEKAKKEQQTAKPQYDFYRILPEMEVVIPESEIKTQKYKESIGKAETGRYILQVGSFREQKKAESLKARLALLGLESKIEKSYVGNITWNRVKVGPFSRMSQADKIRKQLRTNRIDTVVVKTN